MKTLAKLVAVTLLMALAMALAACGAAPPASAPQPQQSQSAQPAAQPAAQWPTTPEGIALYTGADREKMLLEGARKEGKVNWYASENVDMVDPLIRLFEAKYPFIDATHVRISDIEMAAKVPQEFHAGRYTVDVLGTNLHRPHIDAKITTPFKTPEASAIPDHFKHPQGYWVARHSNQFGAVINPSRVPADKRPKNYEDFTDPWWKGKLVVIPSDYNFWQGILVFMGEEKGWEYIRKIAANAAAGKGKTNMVNLVAAGEYAGMLGSYQGRVEQIRVENQAPVEGVYLNPTIVDPSSIAIAAKAPNPHAAMLLIDFILSEEGQTAASNDGRVVSRTGIKSKSEFVNTVTERTKDLKVLLHQEEWHDKFAGIDKKMNELFGG